MKGLRCEAPTARAGPARAPGCGLAGARHRHARAVPQGTDTPQNCGPSSAPTSRPASPRAAHTSSPPPARSGRGAPARSAPWVSRSLCSSSARSAEAPIGARPTTGRTAYRLRSKHVPGEPRCQGRDVLGLSTASARPSRPRADSRCRGRREFTTFPNPPPADGQSGTVNPNPGNRLNTSAQVRPVQRLRLRGTDKEQEEGSGDGQATCRGLARRRSPATA